MRFGIFSKLLIFFSSIVDKAFWVSGSKLNLGFSDKKMTFSDCPLFNSSSKNSLFSIFPLQTQGLPDELTAI